MRVIFNVIFCILIVFVSGCNENKTAIDISSKKNLNDVARLKKQALEIVYESLINENSEIRTNAIEVVSTTGSIKFIPMVRSLLKVKSVDVRFAAAVAIGDMDYGEGMSEIKRLLEDKDENVRIAGAYALTKMEHRNLSSSIRNAIKSKNQKTRANAVLLLGKLGDKKNLKPLYWAMKAPDSNDKVRIQAVEAIARLGDEKIYKKLWTLLISKYADDRVMGIRAMGVLNTEESRSSIVKMLYDDILEVRLCAAEQLGRLGDNTGEEEILHYFSKMSPNINEISVASGLATMAIGRTESPLLVKYLPKLLNSRSKAVQLIAAQSVLLLSKKVLL